MLFKSRLRIAIITFICLVSLYGTSLLVVKIKHVHLPQSNIGNLFKLEPCNCVEKTQTQTTIPKIIHQIWNNDIVPSEFINSVKSLVRDNSYPEWQYVWWTMKSGAKLLKDKYPYLLDKFNKDSPDVNTMRADMLRIVVLHEYGGVYFDLDTTSVRPLASFVDNHECSLAQEPAEHIMGHDKLELLITNSALFCRPQHPFFKQMLFKLSMLTDDCVKPFLCTGPLMVTPLYEQLNRSNGDVVKLPEVQSSKLFQDKYDPIGADGVVYKKCGKSLKEMPPVLSPYHKNACTEWHERGKGNRTISELAYTYHTWFHVYGRKLEELPSNHVFNIIPHAEIYGMNFLN